MVCSLSCSPFWLGVAGSNPRRKSRKERVCFCLPCSIWFLVWVSVICFCFLRASQFVPVLSFLLELVNPEPGVPRSRFVLFWQAACFCLLEIFLPASRVLCPRTDFSSSCDLFFLRRFHLFSRIGGLALSTAGLIWFVSRAARIFSC
jgi:hypothetical protein